MSIPFVEQRVFLLTQKILPGAAGRTMTKDLDLVMDLNADSLSLVSLIYAIEEEFGVGTAELGSLVTESRTVGDLIAAVDRLKKN
jgi:acyl carrier protein